ncbi:MAG: MucR family transcriptional regulator [bacterium]
MIKAKENQTIECLECGKFFKKLSGHLEPIHKMTVKEYLKKYPSAKTSSNAFIEQQRADKKRQYQDDNLNLRQKVGSRTFDFIKDKELKKILQRDYGMAKKCLKFELWKPCIILYGAIIEAVLIDKTGGKKFEEAIEEALTKKIITKNNYHKINIIRDLRNYVHLHKELKEKTEINSDWARTFADICESIIKHFKS